MGQQAIQEQGDNFPPLGASIYQATSSRSRNMMHQREIVLKNRQEGPLNAAYAGDPPTKPLWL